MYPLLLTSKALTNVFAKVISVTKCAYLFSFSVCLFSMFSSRGTVNSKMLKVLFALFQIVISGFNTVINSSGGIVPPPAASYPGISLLIVYFVVSKL